MWQVCPEYDQAVAVRHLDTNQARCLQRIPWFLKKRSTFQESKMAEQKESWMFPSKCSFRKMDFPLLVGVFCDEQIARNWGFLALAKLLCWFHASLGNPIQSTRYSSVKSPSFQIQIRETRLDLRCEFDRMDVFSFCTQKKVKFCCFGICWIWLFHQNHPLLETFQKPHDSYTHGFSKINIPRSAPVFHPFQKRPVKKLWPPWNGNVPWRSEPFHSGWKTEGFSIWVFP